MDIIISIVSMIFIILSAKRGAFITASVFMIYFLFQGFTEGKGWKKKDVGFLLVVALL
jgi:hypothetical protein